MKIDGIGANKVIGLYSNNKRQIEKSEKVKKSDTIELSTVGKSLSSYSSENNYINSKEKLDAISKEVSSGTYTRDAVQSAKKIFDIMKGREV